MQVNPKTIKNQFEKSLKTYNQNAVVQKIMAEKLVKALCEIKSDFPNILELGCGAGLLTQELIKNITFQTYYANDLVEKSKLYIENIIPNVKFYCGNAQKLNPKDKMDLIISNAMFQWFNDLEKTTEYYKRLLKNDGILAFTTFSDENFKEIDELTGISLEYSSFNNIKESVSRHYNIIYAEEFRKTLNFSNPLELLAHIKKTGVNSLTSRHWTFKEVKDFCEKYKEKYPEITLTYSPVIIICSR